MIIFDTDKFYTLIRQIEKLKESIEDQVEKRFQEFKNIGEKGDKLDLYSELCFCILTANWKAKGGIKAQQVISKSGFATFSEEELIKKLKEIGHRFPNTRAKYIIQNRWIIKDLKSLLKQDVYQTRKFLVKNVKGIGWKEASHFLRNVGFENIAIIDKHILRIMKSYNLIEDLPKSGWNEKKYISMENILKELSKISHISLGKLDLYLWYIETGSIDK
ncbi:N-glycosylase/DNA lyase [Petrotoga sp. 9PWA.NaAc.5.4]|uniref:N-glycosylase/DNA lyase n=1 Tax=Petrotoga sp. 9PWA.NaAc.5.4 TaxID=1434328 RepID=UPI000EFBD735|nr:N-glycosylase/DNA lyase [Petrotoga sp. 9PWA.NaAc.5.4]